jgi:large conductance mechanosensitive channel
MLKEFKDFIAKGNVLDLAVGIIIGAAFTAIVTSFVKDIITPIIGLAGKANFDNMFLILKSPPAGNGIFGASQSLAASMATTPDDAEKAGAVVLRYGSFLTGVINFVIIALVVFMIVRWANRFKKPAEAAGPSKTETLLGEIRDLLAAK